METISHTSFEIANDMSGQFSWLCLAWVGPHEGGREFLGSVSCMKINFRFSHWFKYEAPKERFSTVEKPLPK